jgi:lipopolysaccharide transport system permease protein
MRTDFKTRYHGTAGGFIWALLKPAAMFLVLMAVFSFIFSGEPNYRIDLVIGLFLWDFFSEATKVGLASLHARGYLLSKAKFPAWILVVTSISNAFITLMVFSATVVFYLCAAGRAPSLTAAVLFLLYLIALLGIVVGFSLAASVSFLRYRDLNQVWEVILQAGFFVAPIVYPLRVLPERLHGWLYLWAPTPIIEFSRAVLVENTPPSIRGHALLFLATGVSLLVGGLVFRRLAPRAAEYL